MINYGINALLIEAEGFNYEQFTSEFLRFTISVISSGESSHNMDFKDFAAFGFFLTEPVVPEVPYVKLETMAARTNK